MKLLVSWHSLISLLGGLRKIMITIILCNHNKIVLCTFQFAGMCVSEEDYIFVVPCRALRFSVIVLNSLLHISRVGFWIVMRVLGFVYDCWNWNVWRWNWVEKDCYCLLKVNLVLMHILGFVYDCWNRNVWKWNWIEIDIAYSKLICSQQRKCWFLALC